MIFIKLFLTFCKIGIFNFGGGYAMIALIQNEVVEKNAWLTAQEFTDIVALSQMTPGPIGINVATYAGYTAVINSGFEPWIAVLGAFLASFSVILLPFILMIIISHYLLKHKNDKNIATVFATLKLAVVGLIAAAALLLASSENFGDPQTSVFQFIASISIFIGVFIASFKFKKNPILLISICGAIGFLLYGFPELIV